MWNPFFVLFVSFCVNSKKKAVYIQAVCAHYFNPCDTGTQSVTLVCERGFFCSPLSWQTTWFCVVVCIISFFCAAVQSRRIQQCIAIQKTSSCKRNNINKQRFVCTAYKMASMLPEWESRFDCVRLVNRILLYKHQ